MKKQDKKPPVYWWQPVLAASMILAVLVLVIWLCSGAWRSAPSEQPAPTQPTQPTQPTHTVGSPSVDVQLLEMDPMDLGQGLKIRQMGSYDGDFLEDGRDEDVTDVMLAVVENTTAKDLQLARVVVQYGQEQAAFEITDLPAGASVAVLERSKATAREKAPDKAMLTSVLFYQEPMDIMEDVFQITGAPGQLILKNLSAEDITETIWVYYKNSSKDLLYGGITYRAKLTTGLASGETGSILTGHYLPKGSKIVRVEVGG